MASLADHGVDASLDPVRYRFQKGATKMLVATKNTPGKRITGISIEEADQPICSRTHRPAPPMAGDACNDAVAAGTVNPWIGWATDRLSMSFPIATITIVEWRLLEYT